MGNHKHVTQDEVRLPCKLKEDEDMETQIHETLHGVKSLISFTLISFFQ